jgi:hypothetical protein
MNPPVIGWWLVIPMFWFVLWGYVTWRMYDEGELDSDGVTFSVGVFVFVLVLMGLSRWMP